MLHHTSKLASRMLELRYFDSISVLRYFVIIAEAGSFTKASDLLNIDTSMLSRHISAFEKKIDGRLFERNGRGVALTKLGAQIFKEVKQFLQDAVALEQRISDNTKNIAGQITIGALESFSHVIFARFASVFQENFPKVQLTLIQGPSAQIEEWLDNRKIDIGILYRYEKFNASSDMRLGAVDSYLVGGMGDGLTRGPAVSIVELKDVNMVLPFQPNELVDVISEYEKNGTVRITKKIYTNSLKTMIDLIRSQGYHAILPVHSIWQALEAKEIQASRIIEEKFRRIVSLSISKSKGESKIISAASDLIKEVFANETDGKRLMP